MEAFQENGNAYLRYDVWNDRKTLRLDIYLVHRQSRVLGNNTQESHIPRTTYQDVANSRCGVSPVVRGFPNEFQTH